MPKKLSNLEIFQQIDSRLDSLSVGQARIEENLKEHMRRTELNEKQIDHLRKDFSPVRRHVYMVEGVFKFLGILGVLVGILGGVWKILSYTDAI